MATVKPMMSSEIADIQSRMAQIRHDMHQEVRGAVVGAQSLTDWRNLVRSYPWLSLAVASAAGYLIVPHRRTDPASVADVETAVAPVREALKTEQKSESHRNRSSSVGIVLGLLTPILIRAAQNYALNYLENWLT